MKVVEDQVRLPDGTITDYVRFPGEGRSVMILCVIDGKLLVQREYSYPLNEVLYQLPGGAAQKDEDVADAARREFTEECQYKPNNLTQIGWYYDNNRRSKSTMDVFVTTDISEDDSLDSDAEEDIKLEWIPLKQIPTMIREGKIVNHAMLAGWAIWQSSKLNELN